jgi:hypothetical protein
MNAALFRQRRDRLRARDFTPATVHRLEARILVDHANGCLDHVAALICFRDDAIGAVLAIERNRAPGPFDWKVGSRSSPYHLVGNRNAAHPVNAILNYAYAALESEIRIKAISEGYDPTIGIMHEGRDGSSKYIFDLMEPERPKVDRTVLDIVKGQVFDPADFVIRTDGVCRLNPEMARMVLAILPA